MTEKEYIEREALLDTLEGLYDLHLMTLNYAAYAATQDCMTAVTEALAADVTEVRHGEWVKHDELKDDFYHHCCSICKEDAPCHYVETEDYDEGMDGELYFIGMRITDIVEHLTNYCPNCGAKMDGERKEQK